MEDIVSMDFPEELVTEIISRLPVKSVLRFKCVSKSWCNRISAKDFTFLHFNNYKPSHLFVAGLAGSSRAWNLVIASVSPPTRGCAEEEAAASIVYHPLPQTYENSGRRTLSVPEVCGPCNGIFCFFKRCEELIMLWNPLIQDLKSVPESNLPRQAVKGALCVYMVGFGFDSKTNDHKILQIVRNIHLKRQQLEIYSLGSNSWKKLDASPVDSFCFGPLFSTYTKIGWLCIHRQICLFDLSDETFDMIPISIGGDAYTMANLRVFPFRESVAVVTWPSDRRPHYEIWVLNNFTSAQSRYWRKLWTVGLENLRRPLGFCGNSYLIFEDRSSLNVMLYDLLNHDVVDVGATMTRSARSRARAYKESLISVSGDKRNTQKKC